MNMRKIIAVLAAVLMLCAVIPMGTMVSAASIFSANFDNGEVVFSAHADDTAVIEDGVLHWTTVGWKNLYKSFSGVAGTEYVLSVKAKASTAVDLKFVFHNGSWSGYVAPDFVPTLSTEWATYTYHFTPTEKGIVLLLQAKAAAEIWLDDIKVSEYIPPVDPDVPDDAVYFENFEEDHTWASGNASATMEIIPAGDAPATKAENGNYVVKHTIPTNVYPYISDRTGISVQPNTDYIVSFDALNSSVNWPVQVIIAENYWLGGAFVTSLSQQIKPSNTTWETYSFVFNTGDHNKIWLGAKSQWADTTVYFDNFYIAPLNGSVQNDGYLKNGNFEAGALEWLHTSNTEITADDTGAGQGNVITTNELASGAHMFSQPATNLVVDHEYVLSFKVYGRAASSANSAFWVQFPSAFTTWTVDSTLPSAKANNYTPRINVTTNVNAWHDVNITFTAKADVAVINFLNYRVSQGFYSFDDISITPKHNWTDATCTAPKTCACGATEGEALGHTPGAEADCENAQTCTVCGEVLNAALGHSWTDATCTAPKTCSVCGATEGEALGHSYEAVVTAPDCENGGYTTYTCSVCGDSYVADETEALGHSYEAVVTAPDCENGGYTTYTCSVCGDSYVADETEALGHSYDGEYDVDCNVCGAIREVELPLAQTGTSASEDVRGVAARFALTVEGMGIDATTAIYDNATVGGYKLISMGAIASNGVSEKDIAAVYLCDDDVSATAQYAIRVINIPEGKEGVEITFTPYVTIEIDGEATTIYGDEVSASYDSVFVG